MEDAMIDAAECRVNERKHLIGQHTHCHKYNSHWRIVFLVADRSAVPSFWLVTAGPMDRPFRPLRVKFSLRDFCHKF